MTTITAIPTRYRGITFRSRSEARFAMWCDDWSIRWDYEPEGLAFGGVQYLPDFWLPEGKTLVEIKPPMFLNETWKLDALARALPPPRMGDRNGITLWCGMMTIEGFELSRLWKDLGWETEAIHGLWCRECGWPHFIGYGFYDCRRCGCWNGTHLLGTFSGSIPDRVIPPKGWVKL